MTRGRDQRRLAILDRLVGSGEPLATSRLCEVCAEVTGVSGAGLTLVVGDLDGGPICGTDAVSTEIEQLQYDLGEGPSVDARRLDRPVAEPDLANPDTPRWLAFTGPALDAGARAVFSFPLQVGAVRLGGLGLYNVAPGHLTDDQHLDSMLMADVAAQAVLLLQSAAPPGMVAAELEVDADFQYVVHQASGMVAAQLEVSLHEALLRLRAHAFGNERSLTDIANDVVARRLRLGAVGRPEPTL